MGREREQLHSCEVKKGELAEKLHRKGRMMECDGPRSTIPSIQHQKNSTKHPPGDMTKRVQGGFLKMPQDKRLL